MNTFLADSLVAPISVARRSVLVVDDEPGIRAALTAHFEREGWLVTSASGVREAEYRFSQGPFDLLVTDVRLPDGTGCDLLRTAQAQADTPVVLLTAFGSVPQAIAAIRAGASEYLVKPVAWQELRAVAENLTDRMLDQSAGRLPEQAGKQAATAPEATSGAAAQDDKFAQAEPLGDEGGPVPIRQLERLHLEKTLAMTGGNRTHAAQMLGISLRTVRNKIREYGLPPRRYA